MTEVTPGQPGYNETLQRIADVLRQTERDRGEIAQMSRESLREWLDDVVSRVAGMLGVAVAMAQALVADAFTIALNAGSAFMTRYREEYERARQIDRRK